VFGLFGILLVLNALDAYNIGRVPVTWISQLGLIACAGYVAFRYRLASLPAHKRLWVFLGWAALITAVNIVVGQYARLMPSGATTPYALFVSLRFLTILSFIAGLYLVYWLLTQGWRERIVKITILLGTLIAVVAMYIYVAQVYGLPEPPRTRLGTTGALQAVTFTYDFHRAEGTFREPVILASWLMVPFLLSLTVRNRLYVLASILMGGTLLLTGSLSGILSLVVGIGASAIIAIPFDVRNVGGLLRALLVVPLALVIFYGVARPSPAISPHPPVTSTTTPGESPTLAPTLTPSPSATPTQGVNLFGTLGRRIANILRGGFAKSDRDYISDYVAHNRPPLFGSGLGNANLLLGHYLHAKVVAGFISLYLNTLYATGILGLALLVYYLVAAPWRAIRQGGLWSNGRMLFVMAAYIAWLVDFAAGTEELTLMFALGSALLAFEITRPDVLDAGQTLRRRGRVLHPVEGRALWQSCLPQVIGQRAPHGR